MPDECNYFKWCKSLMSSFFGKVKIRYALFNGTWGNIRGFNYF